MNRKLNLLKRFQLISLKNNDLQCKSLRILLSNTSYLPYRQQNKFAFSTTTPQSDPLQKYTFQQLLQLKSTQSLTKAAQLMAQLQIEQQNLQLQVFSLQQQLLSYPQHHQGLIQRIKAIVDNINLQQQQNKEIQKRAQKQLEDTGKYAISKVARQILEISDNLQRSIEHSEKICAHTHSQTKKFYNQLHEIFQQFGIERFDPVGKEFDPNMEESMLKVTVPDTFNIEEKEKMTNTVAECIRTGYLIKGRLLRSAHVVVYE